MTKAGQKIDLEPVFSGFCPAHRSFNEGGPALRSFFTTEGLAASLPRRTGPGHPLYSSPRAHPTLLWGAAPVPCRRTQSTVIAYI
jgi:hypothetical protein